MRIFFILQSINFRAELIIKIKISLLSKLSCLSILYYLKFNDFWTNLLSIKTNNKKFKFIRYLYKLTHQYVGPISFFKN